VLAGILAKAKVPLSFPEEWSWKDQSGWLPMLWRKEESGCEVELEKLSKKEAAAAREAGYLGFDSAIVLTMRGGWDSFQSGAAFGAAIAIATGGCLTEEEGKYISHDAALKWAKQSIAASDKGLR